MYAVKYLTDFNIPSSGIMTVSMILGPRVLGAGVVVVGVVVVVVGTGVSALFPHVLMQRVQHELRIV